MARTLLVIGLLASVVFGWHLYAASDVRRHAEDLRSRHGAASEENPVQVNPLTNVVTIPIVPGVKGKTNGDNPFEAFGKALGQIVGGAIGKALEPTFERELNLRARELYDVYAMMIPYRVLVPDAPKGEEST